MLTVTTPALLFPAISLLLLAYTNRFLVVAQLIRQLLREQEATGMKHQIASQYYRQAVMLRQRISCIKYMQALGILSFIACTISMLAIFLNYQLPGRILLGGSLVVLLLSLLFALFEVLISTQALAVEIDSQSQITNSKRGKQ